MANPRVHPLFRREALRRQGIDLNNLPGLGCDDDQPPLPGKALLYQPKVLFKRLGQTNDDWNPFKRWNPQRKAFDIITDYSLLPQAPAPAGAGSTTVADPGPASMTVGALPFEHPFGFAELLRQPPDIRVGPFIRISNMSTGAGSRTIPAPAVRNLPLGQRLTTLKYCGSLLERFRLYADPNSEGVVPFNEAMHNFYNDVYGAEFNIDADRGMTTLGGPGAGYRPTSTYTYPDAISQAQAVYALAAWTLSHQHDTPSLVESESAMQDHLWAQLMKHHPQG
ncbi:hypothetical protein C8Q78DRAFT_712147 [Trametes maxima]|nr:hypothetical protein C8Q78DRAFT_712147 [Trametes maxima]